MNAAREKVDREGECRTCDVKGASRLDAAHVISRSFAPGQGFDEPDGIVPLCSTIKGGAGCHETYDAGKLDLLPYLTRGEQAAAVAKVGLLGAYRHITGEPLAPSTTVGGDLWSL